MHMTILARCLAPLALGAVLAATPATAQSSASSYSYGTYNPVQAAINRNSMNAAILRQATRGNHRASVRRWRSRTHRHR